MAEQENSFILGKADWDIIKKVKNAVNIPVIGNGDVTNNEKAHEMINTTGCDAIMIGRAALGNPWIFREIDLSNSSLKMERPTQKEILETIIKHYELLENIKGEYVANREMRKHIAWYTKGMPNATEIRRKVNELETKEEVLKALSGLGDVL